jgi:murein DD-endopeptidase MepM/ murein hydrolase activator NlpD
MAFQLGDIFIGSFPITQNFGARPDVYGPLYNLRGHNGIDFGCQSMTLVLSAADGIVTEKGFDAGGYGNYIKITHQGFLTLYAHLNDIQVNQGDHVVSGQLIGHSDNTGFSSAPHLHFGVAPCDEKGIKTQTANGYSGYIDPMGDQCHWDIKNLTSPVVSHEQTAPDVTVNAADFTRAVVQGTQFKVIAQYCVNNGLEQYLLGHSIDQIDLTNNPNDEEAGHKITAWIGELITQNKTLEQKLKDSASLSSADTTQLLSHLTEQQKTGLLTSFFSLVKGVFYTNG